MRTLGECYNPKASCLLSHKNVHCHVNKKLKNVHSSFPEGKNLKRNWGIWVRKHLYKVQWLRYNFCLTIGCGCMDYNKQAIICLGTCHWRVQGIFSPFQVSQIRLLVTRQLTASIVYVYFYFILCIKLKKCLNVMKCNSVFCTLWPHGGKVFLSRRLSSNSKQISQGVAVRFNTH